MKGVIQQAYGPPEVLEIHEIPNPSPAENEVLITVHAAGVNRTDCANLRAKPFIMRFVNGLLRPRRKTPGTSFAGVIEEVGGAVRQFRKGQRVFGFDDSGLSSLAEQMTIDGNKAIATIPPGISFEEAVASIEGAHYAINFLNKLNLPAGSFVLVNGATGAIGSAAVQLLKNQGVRVTATCAERHFELVRKLGAEQLIDYEKEDFTRSGRFYDAVLDTVGKSTFGKCKRVLAAGGIYISSELGWMVQNLFFALVTPLLGRKKVKFPLPLDPKASAITVSALMAEGKFSPLIDRRYPLTEVVDAFKYVESGKKIGNVVVQIGAE